MSGDRCESCGYPQSRGASFYDVEVEQLKNIRAQATHVLESITDEISTRARRAEEVLASKIKATALDLSGNA